MSLFSLAFRNIKMNFKKYIMFFFSLNFSVFTAYTFFALMDNEQVLNAFTHDPRYRSLLLTFGIIIMVFVMFFLISSNNSFIKARKKEISTYSLFGMKNGKIGKLIFLETMIVGITSLVVGIGVGIFFSKLMAMLLLNITLLAVTGNISFSIEPKAIFITVTMFMSIFSLMGLSGLWVINRFQLADLFKADKMSEGRSKGSFLVLIISLLLIGTGYYLAFSGNVLTVVTMAIPILVLVISGTYLFFWGGLPKVLSLMKRNKKSYYQGANLISTSSFSHRMKSIGSVMATISVLSAVATTAIATGFTLYSNIEKNTYNVAGYDMYFCGGEDQVLAEVNEIFKKYDVQVTEQSIRELYVTRPQVEPILVEENAYLFRDKAFFRVYSQSAYNELVALSKSDLKPVTIDSGKAIYVYPFGIKNQDSRLIGHLLDFADQSIEIASVVRSQFITFGERYGLVLNDEDFNALLKNGEISAAGEPGDAYHRVAVFNHEKPGNPQGLNYELAQLLQGNLGDFQIAYYNYVESFKTFGLVCFIGFFMSAVFILMTASLLYFKQVMAAEEERHQYKTLRKIGMDDKTEKRVIVKRLLPIFGIPLVVGIVHSVFAMKTADTVVFSNVITTGNTYLTVLTFSSMMYVAYGVVYGIFYFITKGQYSRIVR